MRIVGSDVVLSGMRSAGQQDIEKSSLKLWVGAQRPQFAGERPPAVSPGDRLSQSPAARSSQPVRVRTEVESEPTPEDKRELELQILIKTVEHFLGRKLKLVAPSEALAEWRERGAQAPEQAATPAPERAGWGMEYDYYASHYEYEQTQFKADGVVQTADGQSIAFSVELNMSREFLQEQNNSVRAGDAVVKDPLVVNFAGAAAELTDTRFSFDIDSDGRPDQIAFVRPGSGFLALDAQRRWGHQ